MLFDRSLPGICLQVLSLRTCDSVYFHDAGAINIGVQFRDKYSLAPGVNLIKFMVRPLLPTVQTLP